MKNQNDISDIELSKPFFYENAFYLTSHPDRIAKMLAHYELFKLTVDLPGDIVECGVFKGASFSKFVKLRNVLQKASSKRIIGFDVFDKFPMPGKNTVEGDKEGREQFLKVSGGEKSISNEKLMEFLQSCDSSENVDLIKGDVSETVPSFISKNPQLKISLLHIDVDLYEPTLDCLNYFFNRVVKNGVIILDDYNGFPGATKAIDEFFADMPDTKINKIPWSASPFYVVKTR